MKTFPIMLVLQGRKAVVVGGGAIGRRKASALARGGAEVVLVDPKGAGAPSGVKLLSRAYRKTMLKGAALVMACTDEAALNSRIASDARAIGALTNVADQPGECDFFLPATLRQGEVIVAVGTGGAAPALARRLKGALARALPPGAGAFASALAQARRQLHKSHPSTLRRRQIMQRICGEEGYTVFLTGGRAGLLRLMKTLLDGKRR